MTLMWQCITENWPCSILTAPLWRIKCQRASYVILARQIGDLSGWRTSSLFTIQSDTTRHVGKPPNWKISGGAQKHRICNTKCNHTSNWMFRDWLLCKTINTSYSTTSNPLLLRLLRKPVTWHNIYTLYILHLFVCTFTYKTCTIFVDVFSW